MDPSRLRPLGLAAAGPPLGWRPGGSAPRLPAVWLEARALSFTSVGGRALLLGFFRGLSSTPGSRDAHRGVSALSPTLDMLQGLLPLPAVDLVGPRGGPPPFRGVFFASPGSSNVPMGAAEELRLPVGFLGVLQGGPDGEALLKSAPLSSVMNVFPGGSWQRLPAFLEAALVEPAPGPARPVFLWVVFPSCCLGPVITSFTP
mmetsp:Transcript_92297/g.246841  ORF Transcript_92297/g.246841 Transcript_92297/m.246841 type:complete len:202 (-) Transcript_92297:997-1602(-)